MNAIKDTPPFLELRDVSKTYYLTKSHTVQAVDSVSFCIGQGEFVTLIGPSGCGKSTTLRMIAGFLKPTQGDILLEGKSITSLGPEQRNIPMVFQNYALFPHLNVFENIAYGLKARKYSEDAIVHDVAMMCQMLNLVGMETRFPDELSDGQQQRVSLARALVIKPKILLFDEPLSNLDARLRIQTRAEIKRMQQILKITVLYVTHDQQEALSIPDRVVVMHKGKIIQQGRPREIYNNPKTPFVADFIGNANFYEACVVSVEPSSVLVALYDETFSVPLTQCDHLPIKGERILLSINPITIALSDSREALGENGYTAIVEQCLFNGQSFEYTTTFGDTSLRVLHPNIRGDALEYATGTPVILTFHPETFHVYKIKE
ncbi:ABC-type spermidine/putrescine transport system, ATPase component [Sphaerochaeta pleomorpha str. Grapes]|uniref:ABC-type spermidine/putrescine transport system, ATPase component n=1 Tax=Sphaerochaeta pleomorpha (strain ATCC BAA-1885 / DSM 22778 / Grapes) TaxID=158190 RepID=G8QTD2_SPHPG|nr:ABC transporter ATP-binding protein [Sphaerochaeta pleomorpha]AEV30173.1 ABC-type spermidine/putrescine transport system, ATPase component [Sphaerochaeta pleomorpha str. Grapes]